MLSVALSAGCGSPTPTSSPTPTPSPLPSADLRAQVDAVVASVPAVRELQPTREVPYEFITREQFQEDLVELNDADVPLQVRQAEERLYKRLGLLPADADLDALVQELYGAQVLAYYQPENGQFYVIGGDKPLGATDKIVVAHEYTHALQDQHFNLKDNTISDPEQGDAQLAQLAVIEGDATLTSQLWASDNLGFGEMLQMLLEGLGQLDESALDDMPLILRRDLEFPYTEGFLFATALHDDGGFGAVNQALQTPPESTEQILHPEKYFAHEAPIEVNLEDISNALGTGWSLVYQQTLGELGIQIMATGGVVPAGAVPGLPVEWPHQDVAEGWGGDRLNMYEGPNDAWRIEWKTDWDTGADAISFRSRISQLSNTFAGSTDIQINDRTVEVSITGS